MMMMMETHKYKPQMKTLLKLDFSRPNPLFMESCLRDWKEVEGCGWGEMSPHPNTGFYTVNDGEIMGVWEKV